MGDDVKTQKKTPSAYNLFAAAKLKDPNIRNMKNPFLEIGRLWKLHNQDASPVSSPEDATIDVTENSPTTYGVCCECGEGCNPSSQACGRCARKMTESMFH